jgi:hypothetical protein
MEQSLPQMLFGYIPAQILYTTAELGIADALAEGPQDCETIAKLTETNPAVLRRLLRALVSLNLVTQLDADRFELTELAQPLRSDPPGSMRDDILLSIMPELWRAWGELPRIARTGEISRDPATGLTAFEATQRHPVFAAKYAAAKAHASTEFTPGITEAYDFSRFGTLADLGGDDGALLAAILAAVPGLRAVLYDLPAAVERGVATVKAAGVDDRCEVLAGDFVEQVRPGADAYLLNHVIRDCDDDKAITILRNCLAAMSAGSKLLLVETVMPLVLTPQDSATYGLTDLNNLVYTGGRERTAEEYRELLDTAGFTLTEVFTVPAANGLPDYAVIEAAPTQ